MVRIALRSVGFKATVILSLMLIAPMISPPPAPAQTAGTSLAQVIAGARKEGTLFLSAPSSLTPRGAEALTAGIKKKWGVNLSVRYVPSRNYPAIVARVMTESKTGEPPSFDVVAMSDGNMSKLSSANLLQKPDWTRIFSFIPKEAVRLEGASVLYATSPRMPAYNTKLLKPQDLPKSWEDLGDPRWKGKLLVPSYADIWAYLSRELGEEKITRLVQKIAANSPVFGTYGQIQTRLGAGEYPLTAYFHFSGVEHLKRRGAPVDFVNLDPIPVSLQLGSVVKGALHPNAAMLFVAFCVTNEGQEIWHKYGARSSSLVRGTAEWKFLQGKKYFIQDPVWYQEHGVQLERKYVRILGLSK